MKIWLRRYLSASLALSPAVIIVLVVYVGCTIWSVRISMTDSHILPSDRYLGLHNYIRLLNTDRWNTSVGNLVFFGFMFIIASLVIGTLMAILMDQRIKGEALFRTIYLYPLAMSFIVTGLIWEWILQPTLGIQKMMHNFGFTHFRFDWINHSSTVLYTVAMAAVWQASGLVMAIMLAGLRGVDNEIWKAARIEGISTVRTYASIVLPMLGGAIATVTVLLALTVVRLFDLIIAMTGGGPGDASEVPAKFIYEYLFDHQDIGLATAASTLMLAFVLLFIGPWQIWQWRRDVKGAAR